MPKNKKNKAISKPAKKKKMIKPVVKQAVHVVEKSSEEEEEIKPKKGVRVFNLLRGMKDILPKEETVWKKMQEKALKISEAYGFGMLETPILEEAGLFVRSIGRGTDVVDKEMYVFEDADGAKVGLRPEFTASAARAYIGHGMHSWPQPVKLWMYGPVFRHDRPQAGRYRQFHQFNCEVMGDRDPYLDAELIVVAYNFLRDLGVETIVHVNSIGTLEDRQRYTVELLGYLRSKRSYLCEDCKKRMQKNPLRVLDCKVPECVLVIEEAPQIIEWLSESSKAFFTKVLEYLDEVAVPYMLRSTLVRGLDYYSDTVFELYTEEGETGAQTALGGGGRYDALVEILGGRPTPACGFAIGLERVASVIRQNAEKAVSDASAIAPADIAVPKEKIVFLAHLGEQARRRALFLLEDLRRKDVVLKHNLGKASLKTQLELANKFNATHTLILGQKEMQDGTIIIRDMESGIQEIVDQKKIYHEVQKLLKV